MPPHPDFLNGRDEERREPCSVDKDPDQCSGGRLLTLGSLLPISRGTRIWHRKENSCHMNSEKCGAVGLMHRR